MTLYTNDEASKELKISRSTIKYWVRTGAVKPLFTQSGVAIWTAEMLDQLKRKKDQLKQKTA